MTEDHECGERPCVIGKYGGAYLRCNRCSKKVYCDCLDKRKEVVQLLNALKIMNPHNTPTNIQVKMKALFNSDTLFEFICSKCKSNENPYEIILRVKAESQKILNELELEKNKLTEKLKETEVLNNELLEKIVILEAKGKPEDMQIDEMNEMETGENELKTELIKTHNMLMSKINESMIIM